MQSGGDAVIMELFKIRLVETDMGVSVSRKKKKKRKGPRIVPLGWGRGLGSNNKSLIIRTLSHSPESIPRPCLFYFLFQNFFICLFGCFRSYLHHVRSFVGGPSVVAGHGLCSPLHIVS